jgi:hypothetical protein
VIGGGYHPDTSGSEYTYSTDANPHILLVTFGQSAWRRYDAIHDAAFRLIGDEVYTVALDAINDGVSRSIADRASKGRR